MIEINYFIQQLRDVGFSEYEIVDFLLIVYSNLVVYNKDLESQIAYLENQRYMYAFSLLEDELCNINMNNLTDWYYTFPLNLLSNYTNLVLDLDFDIIDISGTKYFQDKSTLGLNALALTTTTTNDSIALSLDSRLQTACNAAGCFAQFYNGTYPNATTAKTVLLSDLSQLYLDNYIFSNVTNKIFLIYSSEVTGSALNVVLDRVGARVNKITTWGDGTLGDGPLVAKWIDNDNIIAIPNLPEYVTKFNIRTKTRSTFGTLATVSATKYNDGTVLNNHLICFPYNEHAVLDCDLSNNTIATYGTYAGTGNFASGVPSQLVLSNGNVVAMPQNLRAFGIYNPTTHNVSNYGSFTDTAGNGLFLGWVKISDDNYCFIPANYNSVLNVDLLNQTFVSYGTLPNTTNKYLSYVVVNDDLIVCIPRVNSQILNIHPKSQTVDLYGTFSGSQLYQHSILLSSGKILAVPTNATNILLIDPIAKTSEVFGTFSGTLNYMTKLIELSNGHVIAFPNYASYIIDIDPVNKSVSNLKYLGALTTYKFYESIGMENSIIKINDSQIIAIPFLYTSFLDYNYQTNTLNKLGYFPPLNGTNSSFCVRMSSHIDPLNSKRIIVLNSVGTNKVIDITLR